MKIINSDFDFTSIPKVDRESFSEKPRKIIWYPGKPLYRLLTNGENQIYSPFWFAAKTFKSVLQLAKGNTIPFQAAARARLAVSPKWNSKLNQLCIMRLNLPAYVWVGPAKWQPHPDFNNVDMIGGLEQVYVPQLVGKDQNGNYKKTSDFASIQYYGPVPDHF